MLRKTETEAIAVAEPYIAVVGAVNVDYWGRSFAPLIARDSNPGAVRVSLGGVGRNVAHNLRKLGVNVQLLTALGEDDRARMIEESCRALGVGLDGALRVPGGRTSTYLCITGPDGEPALAVCDADVASCLTPDTLEPRMALLDGAALVVIDGNLTADTLDYLTRRCRAPLFADPVSVTKAAKLAGVLDRVHTVKPNAQEAEALTGERDPAKAAKALVKKGVRRAFVSDGANGIFAAENGCSVHVPCFPAKAVNATGCGDAALAALCRSYLDGKNLEDAARFAAAAGALAAESEETISPLLSVAELEKRIHERRENA